MRHFGFVLLILIPSLTFCYNEELFPISDNLDTSFLYPDADADNDFEIHRRNSNFLRFGRADPKSVDYEDDDNYNRRPSRSGRFEKNDHFIRFGRAGHNYLRFGRGTGDSHVRYGRSTSENKRNKREIKDKRSDSNFLRFGRNNNFLRFGRGGFPAPLLELLAHQLEEMKPEDKKEDFV